MYSTDLTEWLLTILVKGSKGNAYNVGSDDAISISDLAHKVRRVLSAENPVEIKSRDWMGVYLLATYLLLRRPRHCFRLNAGWAGEGN